MSSFATLIIAPSSLQLIFEHCSTPSIAQIDRTENFYDDDKLRKRQRGKLKKDN
jgi:hypothetical protein